MADVLPRIKVTDPPRARTSQEGQENAVLSIGEGMSHVSTLCAQDAVRIATYADHNDHRTAEQ